MTFHVRPDCRLCGGPLETVLTLAPTPPANDLQWCQFGPMNSGLMGMQADGHFQERTYPLSLARCLSCDHFQLPVVVDPHLMFQDYAYQSGTSPVFRKHLDDLADSVSELLSPCDLVVEIGSNDATLLKAFDGTGVRTLGVDPARNLAEKATASGFLTYPGFFDVATAKAITRSAGKAKVILALNVLAHADDLRGIADATRELLTDDGELVLEVAYLPDMLRDGTFDMIYHEHAAFWHLAPMQKFYTAHGLCLYHAEHVDSQGGSIRCYVSKAKREPTKALRALLQDEAERTGSHAVDAFLRRIDQAKADVTQALSLKKAQGQKIAAFGCPAKATTLLHHFGIGRETIDYIVEENPLKIGKFSPGTHVPIVGPERFAEDPPDVCVVLAWNFASNIMERFDQFMGEWLVPLPHVRSHQRVRTDLEDGPVAL